MSSADEQYPDMGTYRADNGPDWNPDPYGDWQQDDEKLHAAHLLAIRNEINFKEACELIADIKPEEWRVVRYFKTQEFNYPYGLVVVPVDDVGMVTAAAGGNGFSWAVEPVDLTDEEQVQQIRRSIDGP